RRDIERHRDGPLLHWPHFHFSHDAHRQVGIYGGLDAVVTQGNIQTARLGVLTESAAAEHRPDIEESVAVSRIHLSGDELFRAAGVGGNVEVAEFGAAEHPGEKPRGAAR